MQYVCDTNHHLVCVPYLIENLHTITVDGKDIELSHESFENLKKRIEVE